MLRIIGHTSVLEICSFNRVTLHRLDNRFHMLLDCPPLYADAVFFLHSSFWAACLGENNYIWSVVKWPRSCCFASWQYLMQIDGFLLWKSPWLTIHWVLLTIVVWGVKPLAPLCAIVLTELPVLNSSCAVSAEAFLLPVCSPAAGVHCSFSLPSAFAICHH